MDGGEEISSEAPLRVRRYEIFRGLATYNSMWQISENLGKRPYFPSNHETCGV